MWDLVAELSSRREPSEDLRARPGGLTRRTAAVVVDPLRKSHPMAQGTHDAASGI